VELFLAKFLRSELPFAQGRISSVNDSPTGAFLDHISPVFVENQPVTMDEFILLQLMCFAILRSSPPF